jgi:putative redox protein
MNTSVAWQEDVHFTAQTGSGFSIEIDGNQEKGARQFQ